MRATRAFAAIAVLALVAGACSGSTPTAAPASGGAAAPSEAALPGGRRVRRRLRPGQHPDRDRRVDARARPDRDPLVLLPRRWRRAGAGRGREAGRREVQRQPPGHPPDVRGGAVRRRQRRPRDRDRVGQRPRHRRAGRHRRRQRVPRPVARPRAADPEEQLRPVGLPAGRGQHLQARRGPGRHPVRDLPLGPVLREEPVRRGRPRVPAAQVRRQVHDARRLGRRLELRHDHQGRQDPDRRQERQGRDPGRLRPRQHRPVGLRAPARRPARHGRLLRRRDAGGGRRQDRPDPGSLEGGLEVLVRLDVEGPRRA